MTPIPGRPHAAALRIDARGRKHLLVSDTARPPVPDDADRVELELWVVPGALADPGVAVGARAFDTATRLLARLRDRLAAARIGLRLYAAGTEAFVSDVTALAEDAGMGAGEVFLRRLGIVGRRVHCVHCRTANHGVATTLVRCGGCGAMLLVRDHFSPRLGAFMGVQVDAEAPGEHSGPEALAS